MDKLFYSISEVAAMLGESVTLVRYWSDRFNRFIKPSRTKKGNRQFTREDIEVLKRIHHLVKVQGMTLDGAEKSLRTETSSTDRSVKVLESLRRIREQLDEIRKSL
ncbi:MAG: MerR family transcriptional regulator [Bacteroidales bacterium]|nr:MerR family transcriptional regulator [Bacteroidales bacterium]